jgi:hypothetical protein
MAKSPPSSPFYWNDWYRDTRLLSPAARGIWMDILCLLHESGRRGHMELDLQKWVRWCGCPQDVFLTSLDEIEEQEVADVTKRNNDVTLYITVKSRRMTREEKARNNNNERQTKHRHNGTVTPPVTARVTEKYRAPSSSSSSSSSPSDGNPLYPPSRGTDVSHENGTVGPEAIGRVLSGLSPRLKELMRDKIEDFAVTEAERELGA